MSNTSDPLVLQSLVDKTLLVTEAGADAEPPYRMLETIREYAAERLEESGGAERLEESAGLFRELGDDRGLRQYVGFLGYVAVARGEWARACSFFAESLELSRHSQDVLVIQGSLLGLGVVAGCEGQPAHAARLWGASDHLRQEHGLINIPLARTRAGYDAAVAAVHGQLGEEGFAAAWDEGRSMSLDTVIAYALEGVCHPQTPAEPIAATE